MSQKPCFQWTIRSRAGAMAQRRCTGCGVPFTTARKHDDQCPRCMRSDRPRKAKP